MHPRRSLFSMTENQGVMTAGKFSCKGPHNYLVEGAFKRVSENTPATVTYSVRVNSSSTVSNGAVLKDRYLSSEVESLTPMQTARKLAGLQ